MEGVVEFPEQVFLVAQNTRNRASFFLENAEINITGKLDSLEGAKITGSKTQDDYTSYLDMNKPLSDNYQTLVTSYQAARTSNDTCPDEKNKGRSHEHRERHD